LLHILHGHSRKDQNGVTPSQALCQQLKGKIEIQRQKAQFLESDKPFCYLGVEITMDLNWKHQIQRMTHNLKNKLDNLGASYASPRQTLNIVRTAIIPSLAYAFAVTPCTPADLISWDIMIDRIIKHKHKLWTSTAAAMIREDCDNFGLGRTSICVEYHRRLTFALTSSLEDPSIRHRTISLNLLTKQISTLKTLSTAYLTKREGTNLHIKRQLNYCMRARQLISIHSSKFHLMKNGNDVFKDDLLPIYEALPCKNHPLITSPPL